MYVLLPHGGFATGATGARLAIVRRLRYGKYDVVATVSPRTFPRFTLFTRIDGKVPRVNVDTFARFHGGSAGLVRSVAQASWHGVPRLRPASEEAIAKVKSDKVARSEGLSECQEV